MKVANCYQLVVEFFSQCANNFNLFAR